LAETLYVFLISPMCDKFSCNLNLPWLNHPVNIYLRAQIMKLSRHCTYSCLCVHSFHLISLCSDIFSLLLMRNTKFQFLTKQQVKCTCTYLLFSFPDT
jgi:hypothetical protein